MSEILRIVDLHVKYDSTPVLRGINLSINRGEKVVIMGPSGSGKSTLLRSIPLLVKPYRGEIYFNNIRVNDPNTDIRSIRQKIGFVFQSYNLFPHLTVLENITLPLTIVKKYPREKAVEKAMEMLRVVGLEDKANKYPLLISGGEQQRAAIARALAMDPMLLLLDEPTSALDPELVDEVLETLRIIAKRGITMMIVTHELDFAEEVADKAIFMDNGVIIEQGNAHEIFYNPKHERTRRFLRRLHRRFHINPKSHQL